MARLARFEYDKKRRFDKKFALSVCIFAVIVLLFYFGFSSLSEGNRDRQKESLEDALNRGIVRYYAVEGAYPASLEELKESYALIYDESRFFVDYRLQGANIFPDITVIETEAEG